MKKFLLLGIVSLLGLFASAQALNTYRFIGNGDFFNPWNWANNSMPPHQVNNSWNVNVGQANIVIEGNCYVESRSMNFTSGSSFTVKSGGVMDFRDEWLTGATQLPAEIRFPGSNILIEAGGVLQGEAWLLSTARLQIDGLFRSGYIVGTSTTSADSVIVNGTFQCSSTAGFFNAPILIRNGGLMSISPNREMRLNGNTITVEAGGTLNNQGIIRGGGVINMNNFTNTATMAPGNSPGIINIVGGYTAASGSKHNFEVGGITTNLYDQLHVSGNATLGGQLNVVLINGFTPSTNHDLPIITGASVSGTFSTVSIPPAYQLVYTPTAVLLRRLTVLPVRFVDVAAVSENGRTEVRWTVAGETGVRQYEVETSADGREYRKMGTVSATGSAQYHLALTARLNRCFLRIRSVDEDGRWGYSHVVQVDKGIAAVPLIVAPNPARNSVRVQFPKAAGNARLQFIHVSGTVLKTMVLTPGSYALDLSVADLPAGVYVLRIEGTTESEWVRFIKQ